MLKKILINDNLYCLNFFRHCWASITILLKMNRERSGAPPPPGSASVIGTKLKKS